MNIWALKVDHEGNISDACPSGMIASGVMVTTVTAAEEYVPDIHVEIMTPVVTEGDGECGEGSLEAETQCAL